MKHFRPTALLAALALSGLMATAAQAADTLHIALPGPTTGPVAQNVASEAAEAEVRQQEEAAQQTATQPDAQSPKKPETRWDRIRHFIRRHVTQGNNDSMD